MNFPLAASLSVMGLLLTAAALMALGLLTKRLKAVGGH
jgi:putative spermidine/putrescine transport system permease protein